MATPSATVAVYCRKCRKLVDGRRAFCPHCGAGDPAGRSALVGALVFGAVAAAAVTAAYAWALSGVWGRWEAKFANLPADHPLAGAAWESAVGLGVGVFLVAWAVAAAALAQAARPVAPPR